MNLVMPNNPSCLPKNKPQVMPTGIGDIKSWILRLCRFMPDAVNAKRGKIKKFAIGLKNLIPRDIGEWFVLLDSGIESPTAIPAIEVLISARNKHIAR